MNRVLTPPLFDEWSWQLRGNCQGFPLELFFPEERGRRLQVKVDRAKHICRSCPVLTTCRD